MRRTLLLLLILSVVGAGAFLYFNDQIMLLEPPPVTTEQKVSPKGAKPKTPEKKGAPLSPLPSLFPSGPMIWVHLMDAGNILKQIKNTNFFKQAVEYKIIDPSKPLWANFNTPAKKKDFFSTISTQLEEKVLMDVLGREMGIALYPPNKEGISNFLIAAKISAVTKLQEKLKRFGDSLKGGEVSVSQKKYKEKTIITYKNKEQKSPFHYVISKDLFLGSSSDVLLQKGIDMTGKEKAGDRLVQSKEFQSLFKASDLSLTGLIFVDIEKITPNISGFFPPAAKGQSNRAEDAKEQLQLLKNLGLTFTVKKGLEIKSTLKINEKKADQNLIRILNLKPRDSKSLKFIPDNSIIYGTNIFGPKNIFEQFTNKREKKEKQKEALKKTFGTFFKMPAGINFEKDVVPFIGNELFYNASAPDKPSAMPIPDLTIGLEIKNRKKIESILEKVETSIAKSLNQKSFQKESYKNYDIHFISFPPNFQPGYSIVDDFLLIFLNKTGIKRSIGTLKGEVAPLKKHKKFIAANFPAKNNGMFYMNASFLSDSLKKAVTEGPAGLMPAKSRKSMEDNIKALDLMRVVQSFSAVFISGNNQIQSNAFVAVKDLPKVRANKELMALLDKSSKKKGPEVVSPTPSPITPVSTTGYIYNSKGKRDPFQSLLKGRQAKQAKAKKLEQFRQKITSLKPVNFHLYSKVKVKNPTLFRKIRDYAHFFKDKKAMEKVPQEEREKKLEDYQRALTMARQNFHDAVLGPLQSEYPNIKLAGVIITVEGNVALVETPDGKGHTVRVNYLVGPNYGVIEKIVTNKIIIVERYVNYIGEIFEKRQEIKLPREGGSI